jgi:hypothetical protein
MWILPKNYPLSSHFAQDMVASKEDLTLQGLNIEQSLMSKSKPTRLRIWQTRWKQGSFYPHLFGRILKPCQYSLFETKLTSLLAVIRVSHLAQQDSEKEQMIQDTCGLTLGDTLNQLDLFSASLKTSKDISALDSEKSSATWKALVTSARGEYSVRVKLALLTKEKESTSWLTPVVQDSKHSGTNPGPNGQRGLLVNQVNWPTPSTRDYKGANGYETTLAKIADGKRAQMGQLPNAVMIANKGTGHLNPDWVEWLMGVPTGWTELGCWEMA